MIEWWKWDSMLWILIFLLHIVLPSPVQAETQNNQVSKKITKKKEHVSLKRKKQIKDELSYQAAAPKTKNKSSRSTEWKKLPKQNWENYRITLSPEIDPLGFNKNDKVVILNKNKGFEPVALPASEKFNFHGQIVGSRTEGTKLAMFDTVYIRADEAIQIGEVYAITREPTLLKSRKSDRIGYSYPILGKLKILGARDSLYIGTIIAAKDAIVRGDSLIPAPPVIKDISPIPGPQSMQGVLLVDHYFSTFNTAQHKEVFIDRGSDDGVKMGMVFRAYDYYDPSTNKKLTSSDFIINADIIVTQVAETISTGLVINSRTPVLEGVTLTLLTDISDLQKNSEFNEKGQKIDEIDELDKLDRQDSLGTEEKKELKQLEKWKGNDIIPANPSPTPSTESSSTPPLTEPLTPSVPASSASPTPEPLPSPAIQTPTPLPSQAPTTLPLPSPQSENQISPSQEIEPLPQSPAPATTGTSELTSGDVITPPPPPLPEPTPIPEATANTPSNAGGTSAPSTPPAPQPAPTATAIMTPPPATSPASSATGGTAPPAVMDEPAPPLPPPPAN